MQITNKIKNTKFQINIFTLFLFFIIVVIGIQLYLLYYWQMNWDEFNEFSAIFTSKLGGENPRTFRYLLKYLFAFIQLLPFNEFYLLMIVKTISFLSVGLGIYYILYKFAQKLWGKEFALVPVFSLMLVPAYFETVTQYRTDTYFTFIFLFLIYRLIIQRKFDVLLPALLLALAFSSNLKSLYQIVIYFFIYGLLWLIEYRDKKTFFRIVKIGLLAIFFFLLMTGLNIYFNNISWETIKHSIFGSARVGFGHTHGKQYKIDFIFKSYNMNRVIWYFIVLGNIQLFINLIRNFKENINLFYLFVISLLLASTILIHQGVYKYYIISLAPNIILSGSYSLIYFLKKIKNIQNIKLKYLFVILMLIFLIAALYKPYMRFRKYKSVKNTNQKYYIETLNTFFPKTVNYVDGFGLLSAHHRNISKFIAYKSIIRYKHNKQRLQKVFFKNQFPVFVIDTRRFALRALKKKDKVFIKKNYIPFYDHIWIYGKSFRKLDSQKRTFNLAHSGYYQAYIKQGTISIDKKKYTEPLLLMKGSHTINCLQNSCENIQIVYGKKDYYKQADSLLLKSADTEKEIYVKKSARYYFHFNLSMHKNVKDIYIDGKRIKKGKSKYIKEGYHKYKNPNKQNIRLHRFGPLFNGIYLLKN